MKKPFIFIAGLIFGAAFYAGGQSLFNKPAPAEQSIDASAIKAAKDVLAHEKERTAALDKRELDLKLQAAKLSIDQNAPGPDNAAAAKSPAAAMGKMAKAAIQQQTDMKMAALKSRLNLTDDQAQALQDIMDKQSQKAADLMDKMFSGKMSKDELQKAMKDGGGMGGLGGDMDTQMKNILSPDQYTAYQGYQNDEKKNAAEAQANMELMQIQTSLQLTEDQKDKVFGTIYQLAAQQAGVDGAKSSGAGIDELMEAKKTAMQAVLTPEQFDTYSKFVDSQKKMITTMTGGADAAASGSSGN